MKTMCPPGYHHNGFAATHALGHMMYGLYIYKYIYINNPIQSTFNFKNLTNLTNFVNCKTLCSCFFFFSSPSP